MSGPQRTCVGCRSRQDQGDLIRVVRRDEASLEIGRTLDGRGAWLCRASRECLERAAREGGFARAFRASVTPSAVEVLRSTWPGAPEFQI